MASGAGDGHLLGRLQSVCREAPQLLRRSPAVLELELASISGQSRLLLVSPALPHCLHRSMSTNMRFCSTGTLKAKRKQHENEQASGSSSMDLGQPATAAQASFPASGHGGEDAEDLQPQKRKKMRECVCVCLCVRVHACACARMHSCSGSVQ